MDQESLEIRAKDCLLDEAEDSQISERSAKNPGTVALSSLISKYQIMEGWNSNGISHETTASSERILQNTRRSYSMIGKREINRKISLCISHKTTFSNGINDDRNEETDRPTVRIQQLKFSHVLPVELKQERLHNLSKQQLIQGIKQRININSQKEMLIPCVESLINASQGTQQQHFNIKQQTRRKSKLYQDSFGISYSPPGGLPQMSQPNQLNSRNQTGKIIGVFSLAQQRKRSMSQLVSDNNDGMCQQSSRNNNIQSQCSSRESSLNKIKQTASYSNNLGCQLKPLMISRRESDDLLDGSDTRRNIISCQTSARTQLSSQSQRQLKQLKIIKSFSPRILKRKQLNIKEDQEPSSGTRPFSSSMADEQIFNSVQRATQQHIRSSANNNPKHNILNYTPLPQIIKQLQDSKKSTNKLDEIDLSIKQRIFQHQQIMSGIQQEQQIIDKTRIAFSQGNKNKIQQFTKQNRQLVYLSQIR